MYFTTCSLCRNCEPPKTPALARPPGRLGGGERSTGMDGRAPGTRNIAESPWSIYRPRTCARTVVADFLLLTSVPRYPGDPSPRPVRCQSWTGVFTVFITISTYYYYYYYYCLNPLHDRARTGRCTGYQRSGRTFPSRGPPVSARPRSLLQRRAAHRSTAAWPTCVAHKRAAQQTLHGELEGKHKYLLYEC